VATSQAPATRAAIVTGGPRGIGRSVVRQLAGDGLSIVVAGYGPDHAQADAAVAEAEAAGAKAITVTADVADELLFHPERGGWLP
jgi:3-oxoacyl-[acyl-carrier protein] reductase